MKRFAVVLLRLKNKTICVAAEQMTLSQISAYRKMGYGVAVM